MKIAGDYIIRLRQLLEAELKGKNLKELEKKDKEDRKESWEDLKETWKDKGCSNCGFLAPNPFTHKLEGNCGDCEMNYKGDSDLIKIAKKL